MSPHPHRFEPGMSCRRVICNADRPRSCLTNILRTFLAPLLAATLLAACAPDLKLGGKPADEPAGKTTTQSNGFASDDTTAELKHRAEAGDADAQFSLGVMYHEGHGMPQDDAMAAAWFRRAAEQGEAAAQYNLGVMYDNGRGVPQDDAMAVAWYRRAAEQGHAKAQYNLGLMYDNGRGVPQDDAMAVAWYRRAAEQGEAAAQYNLGVMYRNGWGVPQDDAMAVAWYRRAAEQGHAKAQYNLGVMYDNGRGVPQDDVLALMWFIISKANGNDLAPISQTMVSAGMSAEEENKAQALARRCLASNYQECGD